MRTARYNSPMDGTNLPMPTLSLALAGLVPGVARDVRAGLDLARSLGVRAVQLDATFQETRPRLLDRSARRDLGASLRRADVSLSGFDLWIPPEHFVDPAHADRALGAARGAGELASELAALSGGTPIVSLALPVGDEGDGVAREVASMGEALGVRFADHAWPTREGEAHSVGLDPALVLMSAPTTTPGKAVSAHAGRVASVRLTDAGPSGRVAVGRGRLDVLSLWGAMVTLTPPPPLVIDVRTLADPADGAERAARAVQDLGL